MLDWLKPILGDGYNEEIDNKIAAEINKGFVAKADYDAAKDAQRRFADVQSGAVAAPASVTIGSVSESYASNTAATIDATPKAQAAEYYRILCLYADVYRGCS